LIWQTRDKIDNVYIGRTDLTPDQRVTFLEEINADLYTVRQDNPSVAGDIDTLMSDISKIQNNAAIMGNAAQYRKSMFGLEQNITLFDYHTGRESELEQGYVLAAGAVLAGLTAGLSAAMEKTKSPEQSGSAE
jgi:hypothetical protein